MRLATTVLASLLGCATGAFAQTPAADPPDTATPELQQPPSPRLPRAAPALRLEAPLPAGAAGPAAGGPQIRLTAVRFSGHSVFTEAQLLAVLGEVQGQAFDLAGLRGLADHITAHYRARGYPFAQALIPAQTLTGGALRIDIIEGRFGAVRATGDNALAAAAQPFLASLAPGQVIDSARLERAVLVLGDQPGLRITPVLSPGQAVGTGDLDVAVERTAPWRASLSVDNQGSRYTGHGRLNAALDVDSAFTLGDQISARLQRTERSLWFGHLGYGRPLGGSGLRAEVSAARMAYTLGQEFATLGASGTAAVTSVGLSYPLLRSAQANLSLAGSWQHRALQDRPSQAGQPTDKTSRSLPLTLSFDARDDWGGGGLTYGSLTHTPGRLRLDATAAAMDAATARTAGSYGKTTLALARLQALAPAWSLHARATVQWARRNLDASEKLSLGGANGVRAAPSGDASGDRGWLTQWELRHLRGAWTPFAFVDAGAVTVNARPWLGGARQERRAGGGVGSRYSQSGWFYEAMLAWRDHHRSADPQARGRQAWVSVGSSF
jgi:hemolysin activation/secretion protein